MIRQFIGKLAPSFEANDLNQVSRGISNYYGKNLLMFFGSTHNGLSESYLPYLQKLNNEMESLHANMLTFSDESRSEVTEYANNNNYKFTIIPFGAFLGEALYGKELGTPRAFIIDKKGIIKHVFPAENNSDPVETIANFKVYLTEMLADN